MKHLPVALLMLCAIALMFFNFAYINASTSMGLKPSIPSVSKSGPTKSFGGKVTFAPIPPPVICTGPGTLIIMSSNLKAAMNTVGAMTKSNDPDKAKNLAKGLLGLLPTFTTSMTKIPTKGGQILGKESMIPNFTKCSVQIGPYKIPIPVYVTTGNYNVSK